MMIPRVIHQIWIGPSPAPLECIDSWRRAHGTAEGPFRHLLWDEAALREGGIEEAARRRGVLAAIGAVPTWAGKADIWRLVILAERGGIYTDADAVCLHPIGELLEDVAQPEPGSGPLPAAPALLVAAYENEAVRGRGCFPHMADIPQDMPLVANGFVACPPRHPVVENALGEVAAQPLAALAERAPWRSVGPGLLTRALHRLGEQGDGFRCRLLPSYTLYPVHCTGLAYRGHGKVYAHQLWGSTAQKRDPAAAAAAAAAAAPAAAALPPDAPGVSVLVCSRDAKAHHVRACLASILHQQGEFRMQVVWVDDHSAPVQAAVLRRLLAQDLGPRSSRWTEVVLVRLEGAEPGGVAAALNRGLAECTHDLVARMDADDVMALDRLERQLAWMRARPDAVCLGTQLALFDDGSDVPHSQTRHPACTRAEELAAFSPERAPGWLANHATLMFRKGPLLAAGAYRPEHEGIEDYDLLLRLLAAHGEIHCLPENLYLYRQHPGQATARMDRDAKAQRQRALFAEFRRAISVHWLQLSQRSTSRFS